MLKLYSRGNPEILLHVVQRQAEVEGRVNIAPDAEYLQVASMRMQKGQTFKAHKHIPGDRVVKIPQESWVVVRGRVQCCLYDLDDTILAEPVLGPGDCSITFRGGHNYSILEDDTVVYEFKTGPYLGIELDKVFI